MLACLIVVGFWWDSDWFLVGFWWDCGWILVGFWWDSVGFWWDSGWDSGGIQVGIQVGLCWILVGFRWDPGNNCRAQDPRMGPEEAPRPAQGLAVRLQELTLVARVRVLKKGSITLAARVTSGAHFCPPQIPTILTLDPKSMAARPKNGARRSTAASPRACCSAPGTHSSG